MKIYASKIEAINQAVIWVQAEKVCNMTLWQPSVASSRPQSAAQEAYIITHGYSTLMGWMFVKASADGLDGIVEACKSSPARDTKTFAWRDEGEYVRLKRETRLKARSSQHT